MIPRLVAALAANHSNIRDMIDIITRWTGRQRCWWTPVAIISPAPIRAVPSVSHLLEYSRAFAATCVIVAEQG